MATNTNGFDHADLEYIILSLRTLKDSDGQILDWRSLWCSNGLLHLNDGNPIVKEPILMAKAALLKMKSASKALKVISKSLDDAIQRVSQRYTRPFRIAGFSSLPDDVIARIFELHHEAESEARFKIPRLITVRSQVLASVCQRFRRIALRLPGLWGEVSMRHSSQWILKLAERTQCPSVFIEDFWALKMRSLSTFLELLRPANQWKSLTIEFAEAKHGRSAFECLTSEQDCAFDSLKTLELRREGSYDRGDDEATLAGRPSTMLSVAEHQMIEKWKMAKLERLIIKSLIPNTLKCHNLKELDLTLARTHGPSFRWDFYRLNDFLYYLYNLESLSLTFSGVRSSSGEPSTDGLEITAVNYRCLTSFSVRVQFCTDPAFVKAFMDTLNAPFISDLSVFLDYNSKDRDECDPDAWLDAIFKSAESTNAIRTFPNVEKFSLSVSDTPRYLPYEKALRALPRVRDLTLDLPECGELSLDYVVGEYGCLRDLRALRLKRCTSIDGSDTATFIEKRQTSGKLKDFDELEVDACNMFSRQKDYLQALLGDKLIWKY